LESTQEAACGVIGLCGNDPSALSRQLTFEATISKHMTDLTEFFKHVPSTQERIRKRLSGMIDDVETYLKAGGDWFEKISEPKNVLGSEHKRCCCKSAVECELLVADELKKSRNPFKWGDAVCPARLGYQHWSRFKLSELPDACYEESSPL